MSNPATLTPDTPLDTPSAQDEQVTSRLNANDRCDQCGHRAWVEVTLAIGVLTFCAHHYARSEKQLTNLGAKVHDERHRLLQRPVLTEPAPPKR